MTKNKPWINTFTMDNIDILAYGFELKRVGDFVKILEKSFKKKYWHENTKKLKMEGHQIYLLARLSQMKKYYQKKICLYIYISD